MAKLAITLAKAVQDYNQAEVSLENATVVCAALGMIEFHLRGADKSAKELVATAIKGMSNESTGKHVNAWIGGAYSKYVETLRIIAGLDPAERRDAMLQAMRGDDKRAWRVIRDEHKAPKVTAVTKGEGGAGGDGGSAGGDGAAPKAEQTDAQRANGAINILAKINDPAELARVLAALNDRIKMVTKPAAADKPAAKAAA